MTRVVLLHCHNYLLSWSLMLSEEDKTDLVRALFFILSSSASVMWLWWTIFCSQNVLMNNLSWIRAELIFCEEKTQIRSDQTSKNLHHLMETDSHTVPDSDQSVRSLKNTHDMRSCDVLWLTSHIQPVFISVWQTCHRWCFSAPPHLHFSSGGTCLRIMIHQKRNDPHYQLMNLMSVRVSTQHSPSVSEIHFHTWCWNENNRWCKVFIFKMENILHML